jgi:anti-anti-sigma factor
MGPELSAETVTVTLPTRLDSTTSASVEATVMAVLRDGVAVVVDGSEVDYMSAAGVRVLVDAYRKASAIGARLTLCRFTGAAADCLAVSGFADLLPVVASLDDTSPDAARRRL